MVKFIFSTAICVLTLFRVIYGKDTIYKETDRTFFKISKLECIQVSNICKTIDCTSKPINSSITEVTAICDLREPVPFLILNMIMELKNNKDEYFVIINETVDYCKQLGTGHKGILGNIEKLINKVAPDALQTCPIKNKWGVEKLNMDSSILDGYPIWALPYKSGRACIKAYKQNFEFLGEIKGYGEVGVAEA